MMNIGDNAVRLQKILVRYFTHFVSIIIYIHYSLDFSSHRARSMVGIFLSWCPSTSALVNFSCHRTNWILVKKPPLRWSCYMVGMLQDKFNIGPYEKNNLIIFFYLMSLNHWTANLIGTFPWMLPWPNIFFFCLMVIWLSPFYVWYLKCPLSIKNGWLLLKINDFFLLQPLCIWWWSRLKFKLDWLLFNANSAILQLYQGKNKLIFSEMMMRSTLY